MSKMTIKDEVKNFEDYKKLKLVEFLEFIGRLAYQKFINDQEMEFDMKIDYVLDQIFAVWKIKKESKVALIDDENTSDESCIVEEDELI